MEDKIACYFTKHMFVVLGYGKTRLFSFTISPFFWNVLGKTHIRKCLFLVVGPFPSDKKFKKVIRRYPDLRGPTTKNKKINLFVSSISEQTKNNNTNKGCTCIQ